MECKCGNPEIGFECVCDWVENHPGNRTFSCEFCGLYNSSEPRCSKCEDVTTSKNISPKFFERDVEDVIEFEDSQLNGVFRGVYHREGINTIYDLVSCYEEQFRRFKNVGKNRAKLMVKMLESKGLSFGMRIPKPKFESVNNLCVLLVPDEYKDIKPHDRAFQKILTYSVKNLDVRSNLLQIPIEKLSKETFQWVITIRSLSDLVEVLSLRNFRNPKIYKNEIYKNEDVKLILRSSLIKK